VNPLEEQQRLVTYLDGLQSQVSCLRQLRAETQKELDAMMPSILDKAFKGEL
jgi:type I restriction enzyme S subunit